MARKGEGISEEKAKRIAVGATVAGVLLIIFLVIILIVQFVQIGVANGKQDRLNDLIGEYEQQYAQSQNDLDYYKSGEGLYYYARLYGFK